MKDKWKNTVWISIKYSVLESPTYNVAWTIHYSLALIVRITLGYLKQTLYFTTVTLMWLIETRHVSIIVSFFVAINDKNGNCSIPTCDTTTLCVAKSIGSKLAIQKQLICLWAFFCDIWKVRHCQLFSTI